MAFLLTSSSLQVSARLLVCPCWLQCLGGTASLAGLSCKVAAACVLQYHSFQLCFHTCVSVFCHAQDGNGILDREEVRNLLQTDVRCTAGICLLAQVRRRGGGGGVVVVVVVVGGGQDGW